MENPSWYLYEAKSAKIEDSPKPVLEDDHDVIIRIDFVGVCGSDVHFWRHGGIGAAIVTPDRPLILGHEAAGTIAAIGPSVTSVKVGDRVAIEPGFPCRRCTFCKSGEYNLCRSMKFAAAPPDCHGTLTKHYKAPEDFVYKIPDHVSLQQAVLVEPTAVAVHSARLANIAQGQEVVIMGSGTVGLLCGAVAKAFGARRVLLVDILEKKLEFATRFLDCEIYQSNLEDDAETTSAKILKQLGLKDGVDAVIDASGAEISLQVGIHILKPGGSYVQAGLGKPKAEIPILALSEKELRVRGCFRYATGDFEIALDLISKGLIKSQMLISSVSSFEDAPKAWEKTANGEGIKNMIQVSG